MLWSHIKSLSVSRSLKCLLFSRLIRPWVVHWFIDYWHVSSLFLSFCFVVYKMGVWPKQTTSFLPPLFVLVGLMVLFWMVLINVIENVIFPHQCVSQFLFVVLKMFQKRARIVYPFHWIYLLWFTAVYIKFVTEKFFQNEKNVPSLVYAMK